MEPEHIRYLGKDAEIRERKNRYALYVNGVEVCGSSVPIFLTKDRVIQFVQDQNEKFAKDMLKIKDLSAEIARF